MYPSSMTLLLLHAALLIPFYHFCPVLVHPTFPSWPWMCLMAQGVFQVHLLSTQLVDCLAVWLLRASPAPQARTSHTRFH